MGRDFNTAGAVLADCDGGFSALAPVSAIFVASGWICRDFFGIDVQAWGAAFSNIGGDGQPASGTTIWSLAPAQGEPYAPGTAPFMINYRVDDLDALLDALRAEGCQVLGAGEISEYGKFGWVLDPEGTMP